MNILNHYHYCPACGSSDFRISGPRNLLCEACGYRHFVNASASVAVWITDNQDNVLICRRRFMPAAGTLDLPGGFVEPGETAEEAVCREVMEETHLRVANPEYAFTLPNMYHYGGAVIPTLDLFFRCRINESTLIKAGDDAEACQWIHWKKIDPAHFGLTSVRQGVQRFLEASLNGH